MIKIWLRSANIFWMSTGLLDENRKSVARGIGWFYMVT